SLRLVDIANYAVHVGPLQLPLLVLTPIGFVIYLLAAVAETNRAPFDLPEAEQELVGGFHTEYSGFKFAMFYLAEYMNIVSVSAIAAILFLGGATWPAVPFVPGIIWLLLKILLGLFFYIWLRSTLPRL